MASNATTHVDRVAETITASGTGPLTMSGTAVDGGYRTFAAANIPAWSYVHYAISDAAGNWEVGRGQWNGTTVSRNSGNSKVFASSNANLVVDFPLGELRVDIVLPATFLSRKIWFSTVAPTVNDDRDDGFFDGALWLTNDSAAIDRLFYLQSSATGAASWLPIGPVVARDFTVSYQRCHTIASNGTFRWDLTNANTFNSGAWNGQDANYCVALGRAANLENEHSLAIGAGRSTGHTKDGGHQAEILVKKARTTDATPTLVSTTAEDSFAMHENGASCYLIQVVGYSSTGECYAKEFKALVSRATGNTTIVAQSSTDIGSSAGAAAWACTLGAGTYPGHYGPIVTVTGAAATTVNWTATAWRTSAHNAV